MIIQRLLLVFLVASFIMLSLYLRLGNVTPEDFVENRELTVTPDISWHAYSESELVKSARTKLEQGNYETGRQLALKAWRQNATSGRAASQLLDSYDAQSNTEQSDAIAELTSALWPANTPVRAKLANYWAKRNNLRRALPEWNALMIRSPSTRKTLFPAFAQMASQPETFPLLLPFMETPPAWWSSFFPYLTRNSESLEVLKTVYATRTASDVPLSTNERRSFVNRLLKEKQYLEAYFAWLGGLEPDQLALSGLVYDGGFEGDSFNSGFDWHIRKAKGLRIRTSTTSGLSGARALQITLNTKRLKFNHISQRLNLTPGTYQLSGKYRVNRLKASRGLSWHMYCVSGKTIQLVESSEFRGRVPWSEFKTETFAVPTTNCSSQLLRLEATSNYAHHQEFKGSIWFDDISISRVQSVND